MISRVLEQFGSLTELDEIDSTNSFIQRELVREDVDVQLPWIVIAKRQMSGRGRNGNSWLSHANSLTFSIAWQPSFYDPHRLSMLPLHIGVTVGRAIAPFITAVPKVKWPNDVMVDGKKLAGILIESFQRPNVNPSEKRSVFVIGIGLNITNEFSEEQQEVALRATSIREHLQTCLEISDHNLGCLVFESILQQLSAMFKEFDCSNRSVLREWPQHCFLTGRNVSVQTASGVLRGECQGIDQRGAILVRDENGMIHSTLSGQVVKF